VLAEDDLTLLRQHKAELLLTLRLKSGTCPHCQDAADLQDRERDVWWCAGCRKFFDGAATPLPPIACPRPLTLEQYEAEQLAADLLAVGCQFMDDGEYFQVKVSSKITMGLLARLEAADRSELRRAAAKLAELDAAKGWAN
jgi:ribosomal protein L37AE/L43A